MTSLERINAVVYAVDFITASGDDGAVQCEVWEGGSSKVMMVWWQACTDSLRLCEAFA